MYNERINKLLLIFRPPENRKYRLEHWWKLFMI